MPKKGGGNTVQIVQRHHFASHLKRTAVVVRTEEKFYAFVKAAPETIQERLNDTPAYYVSTYKRYTREGSHVLALAYKPLPDMTVSKARNLDREVVESGLTFAGFAVKADNRRQWQQDGRLAMCPAGSQVVAKYLVKRKRLQKMSTSRKWSKRSWKSLHARAKKLKVHLEARVVQVQELMQMQAGLRLQVHPRLEYQQTTKRTMQL